MEEILEAHKANRGAAFPAPLKAAGKLLLFSLSGLCLFFFFLKLAAQVFYNILSRNDSDKVFLIV